MRRALLPAPPSTRGVTFAGCDVENWIQVWGGVYRRRGGRARDRREKRRNEGRARKAGVGRAAESRRKKVVSLIERGRRRLKARRKERKACRKIRTRMTETRGKRNGERNEHSTRKDWSKDTCGEERGGEILSPKQGRLLHPRSALSCLPEPFSLANSSGALVE